MKKSKKHKQKFQENVGYEADREEHSTPTPTVGFDHFQAQLNLWKIDQCEFGEADTPEKLRSLLLAKGVKPEAIAEFLADLQSGKALPTCESPPVLNAATPANAAPHTDATDPGSRWPLPAAMEHARQTIANYLSHDANDLGWEALGLEKLFAMEHRRLTEEQMEQLEKMSPLEKLPLLTPPGVSVAEVIAGFIRLNPRSLLDPNSGHFVEALVDLLEAAHFGNCANRFPGLLPTDNRKRAASTARKALGLLAKGSQGNPPGYPPEILAGEVGLIQDALAPIKKAWANSGSPKVIKEKFGDDVKGFTDKKLRSLLSDPLLVAAARLAEEATGVSAESFETAWEKAPSIQKVFKAAIAQ